ncbi:methylmalonic aciduria and homocystinuria type D homolog, mitochondrial [Chironomus tepperi]|uniref:methylmalonic aciduria and homocystinuria type D homolog, mitochondrial n=1 Tax=Chironomus tepperi TaxID=113505 RepID=UPI00391F2B75
MNISLIFVQRRLLRGNKAVISLASYSRNSSNSKSPYKIVQARIKNDSNNNMLVHENGANWELFGAKNNRFFLGKGSVGPAYLNSLSTHTATTELDELIDLDNKDKTKLHLSFQKCPMLIRKNLQEMFPAPEVITETSSLSLIILSQPSNYLEHEKAAIKFIFAAREICQRLRLHGYWADFLNPFSGKAFFSYHQKSLYKNDERFRGLCMKLESIKGFGNKDSCLLISEDKSPKFSGSVFTNLPSIEMFKELVLEEDEIK